jgi:hypothetical protein
MKRLKAVQEHAGWEIRGAHPFKEQRYTPTDGLPVRLVGEGPSPARNP